MDVFDAVRIVVRRWYVVLPVLLVTAVAVVLAYRSADVEYTASSSVGVAGPSVVSNEPAADGTVTTNSLLANGGTTLLANLLSIRLQDPEAAAAVVSAGGNAGYTVEVLTRSTVTQLPVVSITATGTDAASVTRTLDAVNAQADASLAAVQAAAGVPSALYAKSYVVQAASSPVAGSPDRTRTAAIVGVVGVIIAVLAAALLDAFSGRRRRAAQARHSE